MQYQADSTSRKEERVRMIARIDETAWVARKILLSIATRFRRNKKKKHAIFGRGTGRHFHLRLTSTMGADDDGDDKGDEEVTKGGAESASLPEGLEGTTAIFIHG